MTTTETSDSSPCRVAVIGAGPAGLFFCHHVAERRRLDPSSSSSLPEVTCFEAQAVPGGNWRSDRVNFDSSWTNGNKEPIELFDYTFADHYGKDVKLPVYLPRGEVLDYMLARVKRHCPDFLEQFVQFNTKVQKVTFNADNQKFTVATQKTTTTTSDIPEENVYQDYFDKVVWAAGEEAVPFIPKELKEVFSKFTKGPVEHSSKFREWEKHGKDKHILLIAGSYSALDMAYTAVKQGAKKVTIVYRGVGYQQIVEEVETWPQRKVFVQGGYQPILIDEDQDVICGEWDAENGCVLEDEDTKGIIDVDTVIFCTGYKYADHMLDPSCFQGHDPEAFKMVQIPKDWSMAPNVFDEYVDKIPAPPTVRVNHYTLPCPHSYFHSICGLNPNLMYATCSIYEEHILTIDIQTLLMLKCIMGEVPVPSLDEIMELNRGRVLEAMDNPHLRSVLDSRYAAALNEVYEEDEAEEEAWSKSEEGKHKYNLKWLGKMARVANYPTQLIEPSSDDDVQLSSIGNLIFDQEWNSYNYSEDPESKYKTTVHDLGPESMHYFKSIHTGNVAVPLKQRWLELDHTLSPVDMVDQTQQPKVVATPENGVNKATGEPIDVPISVAS